MPVRRLLLCLAVSVTAVLASGGFAASVPAFSAAHCIATVKMPESAGYGQVRGDATLNCFLATTVTARLCISGPSRFDCTPFQTFTANPYRQWKLWLVAECYRQDAYTVTVSGTAENNPFSGQATGVTCVT
jgi:hypothetical protein